MLAPIKEASTNLINNDDIVDSNIYSSFFWLKIHLSKYQNIQAPTKADIVSLMDKEEKISSNAYIIGKKIILLPCHRKWYIKYFLQLLTFSIKNYS